MTIPGRVCHKLNQKTLGVCHCDKVHRYDHIRESTVGDSSMSALLPEDSGSVVSLEEAPQRTTPNKSVPPSKHKANPMFTKSRCQSCSKPGHGNCLHDCILCT